MRIAPPLRLTSKTAAMAKPIQSLPPQSASPPCSFISNQPRRRPSVSEFFKLAAIPSETPGNENCEALTLTSFIRAKEKWPPRQKMRIAPPLRLTSGTAAMADAMQSTRTAIARSESRNSSSIIIEEDQIGLRAFFKDVGFELRISRVSDVRPGGFGIQAPGGKRALLTGCPSLSLSSRLPVLRNSAPLTYLWPARF